MAALGYEKLTGIIESISSNGDFSNGTGITGKNIDVRNSSGTLHRIITESAAAGRNEQKGTPASAFDRELVVYKDGAIGDSSLLKNGDRIEYITRTADKTVKYINVLSNVNNERYVAAQITAIDRDQQAYQRTAAFQA